MRIRNIGLITVWTLIVCMSGIAVLAFDEALSAVSIILLLFGLQGLVSEIAGVVVVAEGISFPRRLWVDFPISTLWRKTIDESSFNRIDRFGRSTVNIFTEGNFVSVPLPSHEYQKKFLHFAATNYPRKQISR